MVEWFAVVVYICKRDFQPTYIVLVTVCNNFSCIFGFFGVMCIDCVVMIWSDCCGIVGVKISKTQMSSGGAHLSELINFGEKTILMETRFHKFWEGINFPRVQLKCFSSEYDFADIEMGNSTRRNQ